METKKQELPKWFNGEMYGEGSIVENPFSKEEYELNNIELSMYDFIIGCQFLIESSRGFFNPKTSKLQQEMAKGLGWFRKNNPEAYIALLD